MKTKFNIYEAITEKIVAQMEKGIIPWQRPWSGGNAEAINYVTRKPYSFINQMLLGKTGEWLTFKQIKERGGSIKKGAESRFVVFYSTYNGNSKNEEEVEEEQGKDIRFILRYYHVFHIDDCTGIESKIKEVEPANDLQPVERAEEVIKGYLAAEPSLHFHNDKASNEAFYRPSTDTVVVPMMSQYEIVEEYYSTAFHELTHSTMTEDRCNRKSDNKVAAFGSKDYSREELVAEMGAAMLVNVCGMDCAKAFENSVAYLQGWLKHLKNDPRAIVWASARAEKAARYIQGER